MLVWIVIIASLVIVVAVGTWLFGAVFGRGPIDHDDRGKGVLMHNRAFARAGQVDGLRFNTTVVGYNPDHVDDALLELQATLRGYQEREAELKGALRDLQREGFPRKG